MITARPGTNATSIPILTEVLELPQQLATPVPVVPQELVPQHLIPEPVTPPPPEPLVMRTRGAGGPAAFSTRLVDAAGLSEHAVQESPAGAPTAPEFAASEFAVPELAAPDSAAATPVDKSKQAAPVTAPAADVAPAAYQPRATVTAPTLSSVTSINSATPRTVSSLSMVPPAPAAPALDLDALAERLHANVLADLQERIEPVLHARMMERLQPVLRTALADISLALQEEIASMVDEAVQKALIQHVTTQD
jgi:hypothetical protein